MYDFLFSWGAKFVNTAKYVVYDKGAEENRKAMFAQNWPQALLNEELNKITKIDKSTFDRLWNEYVRDERRGALVPTEADELVKQISFISTSDLSKNQKEEMIATTVVSFIRTHPERSFADRLMKFRGTLQCASAVLTTGSTPAPGQINAGSGQ